MNVPKAKLLYGLRNGELIPISEVESGLKCDCVCPACGEHLVAKKGNKMVHHFAHKSGVDCEYGYETSLHYAAKQIISAATEIIIPPVQIQFGPSGASYRDPITFNDALKIPITRVELEQHFDNVIPDIVVYSGNKKFFIEIYVTHPIDDQKLQKLKAHRISTIEINLSSLYREQNGVINPELLHRILLGDSPYKIWKYNAAAERIYQKFLSVAETRDVHGYEVYDCPLGKRHRYDRWHRSSKTYAVFIDDCLYCPYNIDSNGSFVRCTGKRRISTLEDFSIPDQERIKRKKEDEEMDRKEMFESGKCPECGWPLVKRFGKKGLFYGCSHYPTCHFTAPVPDEQSESSQPE